MRWACTTMTMLAKHMRQRSLFIFLFYSIPHSRRIYLLLFLLLEVADAVDGGEGIVRVRHPDTHGVVLVGYRGAGVDVGIQDIFTLSHETPFTVLGGVAEGGIESQEGINVVETLDGLCLEEWIEGELYIVPRRQLGNGHATEDTRETSAVNGQVEELCLVVTIEGGGHEVTVEPTAKTELCRGLQAEIVGIVEVGLLHHNGHAVGGLKINSKP